ncbi:GFA family protein [Erythrobacter mangrovi]|uniref:GFA family protein n=1 Tax=Erythrobacter mangrovi TaxID=2739433 RepID=A0A7D4B6C4_9SPHN|nr:GFA family protein [Erythrobacter mangrovi]QKG70243.1 GFA family protein [Erythrobacter mangrovi]
MAERERGGGCGCGHVRYSVAGNPIFTNNCHCTQCQHQTGSTSVVNAFYEAERITLESGELTEHVVTAGSGGPHTICRCSKCGAAVWSYYPRLGRLGAGLRVGTLDEPQALIPDAVVHLREKMPWVTPPEGIPQFEGYYDPAEILPPDRVARLKDLVRRRETSEGA